MPSPNPTTPRDPPGITRCIACDSAGPRVPFQPCPRCGLVSQAAPFGARPTDLEIRADPRAPPPQTRVEVGPLDAPGEDYRHPARLPSLRITLGPHIGSAIVGLVTACLFGA